jgi:hypothetical protein
MLENVLVVGIKLCRLDFMYQNNNPSLTPAMTENLATFGKELRTCVTV